MLDRLQGERNIGIYKLSPYPTLSWNIYGRTTAPFSFPGRFAVVDIFTKPFYFAEQMLQLSVDFIFPRCSFSNLRTKSFAFFHGLLINPRKSMKNLNENVVKVNIAEVYEVLFCTELLAVNFSRPNNY